MTNILQPQLRWDGLGRNMIYHEAIEILEDYWRLSLTNEYIRLLRHRIFLPHWDFWIIQCFRNHRSNGYFLHSKNQLFSYNDNSQDRILSHNWSKWYVRGADNTRQRSCRLVLCSLSKQWMLAYCVTSCDSWFPQ